MSEVGTVNEKALHLQLKEWYAEPGDRFEVPVGRYVVDIVRGDELIEIQTRNVSALRVKLPSLLETHRVRLVLPLTTVKRIVKIGEGGEILDRRRSPKRGSIFDLFAELVSIPELLTHPRFTVHALLIEEEELRQHQEGRNWRRKGWGTLERRLDAVRGDVVLETAGDLVGELPALPARWTTADLAHAAKISRRLAQQCAYTLKHASIARVVGKDGNAVVYCLESRAAGDANGGVPAEP